MMFMVITGKYTASTELKKSYVAQNILAQNQLTPLKKICVRLDLYLLGDNEQKD